MDPIGAIQPSTSDSMAAIQEFELELCGSCAQNLRNVKSETASELNEELGSPVLPKLYSARSSMNLVISIDFNLEE